MSAGRANRIGKKGSAWIWMDWSEI
jgi:hypothetical protein